jgi:prephenate dehydrogenase
MNVGIVGYGRFGRALGGLLEEAGVPYRALDPAADIPEPHRSPSLSALIPEATHLVVAVPVAFMREVLQQMSPHLRPDQLVLDVGSVKVKPVHAMTEVLGTRVPWVGTHPLFGPLSLALAERPLRVVVCPNPLHPTSTPEAVRFFERLGCEIIEQTPEGHDRVMAHTHALTFFVAKGMVDAGSGVDVPFAPASFQALSRTIQLVRSDAGHLFSAIQHDNPFAREARGHLLEALTTVHRELDTLPPGATPSDAPPLTLPTLDSGMPELRETRDLIDQMDRELVELLARRAELARRALRAKSAAGQPVPDPAREDAMIASRRDWATERGLEPDAVESIFRAVLRFSRRDQHRRG